MKTEILFSQTKKGKPYDLNIYSDGSMNAYCPHYIDIPLMLVKDKREYIVYYCEYLKDKYKLRDILFKNKKKSKCLDYIIKYCDSHLDSK